jgi:hypothetical protein
MARRARAFVASRYDWQIIGQTATELIERTVRARLQPRPNEGSR